MGKERETQQMARQKEFLLFTNFLHIKQFKKDINYFSKIRTRLRKLPGFNFIKLEAMREWR